MSLITYSPAIEAMFQTRRNPPRTSYLDLLQLQAYWSPERLNHHTAPTSLVYGLREALRLLHTESLPETWQRHARCGRDLRAGLQTLGLEVSGDGPYAIVHLTGSAAMFETRQRLRDDWEVHVRQVGPHAWRVGLLGADARPAAVRRVLLSIEKSLSAA
jgi:aspartate aminotransferase-like enzyme